MLIFVEMLKFCLLSFPIVYLQQVFYLRTGGYVMKANEVVDTAVKMYWPSSFGRSNIFQIPEEIEYGFFCELNVDSFMKDKISTSLMCSHFRFLHL